MAFDLRVYTLPASPTDPFRTAITAEYSDVISMVPEYILQAVVSKMADKFVELHYEEIEKSLDPKLIAAVVTAQMGARVEEKMMQVVRQVNEVAEQALRRAKKR